MRSFKTARFLFLLLVLVIGHKTVISQENHYWSQQFGAVGSLTGGAMIAGVRDNSAAFYNPGALAFIEYPNLSVDANVYKLSQVYITDGAGSGINLNSAQMNIYPQILAGMINYLKVPRLKFSYSVLTRNFNNILMNTRYARNGTGASGEEPARYLGELEYVNQLNEQWFGLCASYRLKDHLGLGITFFGVYRGQTSGMTNNSRGINMVDSSSTLVTANNSETVKYYTFGILAKIGLAYETGHWKFGFSLTTPSLGLYGNGKVKREESYTVTPFATTGQTAPYLILAEKTDVRANYHHPFSIGFGVEYTWLKTRIALSGEYYTKVGSYLTMNPQSDAFVYPSGIRDSSGMSQKIEQFLYVAAAAKPVFNAGIGLDQGVGKNFNLLLGARTDYSSYSRPAYSSELLPETGTWDLYYLSAGVSYHRPKQMMTLGFTYSFSLPMEIDPIVIVSPGGNTTPKALIFAQSFGVVLGYTYYFPR